MPTSGAERSKAWACRRSPAGIAGSNSAEGIGICLLDCCLLSGSGLCDELINHSSRGVLPAVV